MKFILTDIEGTTTPITFVHEVLFPYSYDHLPRFVEAHQNDPVVQDCLRHTMKTVAQEGRIITETKEAVEQLQAWIQEDRKHPALKTLQGLIWRLGYEQGAFQSQIYPDVKMNLKSWKAQGFGLGIYSSGSVEAQRLLFSHTPEGDLTPFFSHYFDTAVGGKREVTSYERILRDLNLKGSDLVFLSDVPEELVAARGVGIHTIQLVRPGTSPGSEERHAANFDEVTKILTEETF